MTAGRALLATCHPCPPGSLRSKRTSGYGWLLPTGTGRTEIMPDLTLPAPAKLNLFLHIVGRRPDGYHELQTLFQFLDYGDELSFTLTPNEPGVRLARPVPGVPDDDNLVVKAAQALATHARTALPGVLIHVHKRLPMGGGLGGGSSNAATTLLAMNKLWRLALDEDQLAEIGLALGADVPVFVRGQAGLLYSHQTARSTPEIFFPPRG